MMMPVVTFGNPTEMPYGVAPSDNTCGCTSTTRWKPGSNASAMASA